MKEQNEKQAIEEMVEIIDQAKRDMWEGKEYQGVDFANHSRNIAKALYNAGYRKQSVGYWIYDPDGMDWGLGAWICSECGCKNDNLPGQKDIKPLQWAGAKFCPECGVKMIGARMKGGAE